MSMFLGTHNHSRTVLKSLLQETVGYEEILCDIYDVALRVVDTEAYIKHKDMHSLLKVGVRHIRPHAHEVLYTQGVSDIRHY